MNAPRRVGLVSIICAWAALAGESPVPVAPSQVATDTPFVKHLDFPPTGPVVIYLPDQVDATTDVVLLASGDGGWNAQMIDIAARIQAAGKIVAGFSTAEYLKRAAAADAKCANPAGDLVGLSQFVQRQLGSHVYRTPMLVGYASGASLAYVVAAQAPINAFVGSIAVGFCPVLALEKPLCRRGALRQSQIKGDADELRPIGRVVTPLEVLPVPAGGRCKTGDEAAFMQDVDNSHVVPMLEPNRADVDAWLQDFFSAYAALAAKRPVPPAAKTAELAGLPLIERPVESPSTTLIVMLSGDGGWSTLTERVTDELNASGLPVVGWNTLKYFWTAKAPERASADLAAIIRYFSDAWHTQDVILAGYSMGADVLPGIVNRLAPAEQRRVRSVVLMAPGRATDYEFHISGWLQRVPKDAPPIAPEVENMPADIKLTCIYGSDEADRSLCTQIDAGKPGLTLKELPGAHHFDGDYEGLARLVR
jgi:type IV secretory pathway VirJ component